VKLGVIRKTVTAIVGAVLTWALPVVNTGHVNRFDWYSLAVALATACGVYAVQNDSAAAAPDPGPELPVFTPEPSTPEPAPVP